jgi:hypothetical protein
MSDEPIPDAAPVLIGRRGTPDGPPPAQSVVDALHASLRASEVYVRVLIDRVELARTSDLVRLDRMPADALVQLTALSDALQGGADRALRQLDPALARTARALAELAREPRRR